MSKRAIQVLTAGLAVLWLAYAGMKIWNEIGVLAVVDNAHVPVKQSFGPSWRDAAFAGYEVAP